MEEWDTHEIQLQPAEGSLSNASVDLYEGGRKDTWAKKDAKTKLALPQKSTVSEKQAQEWKDRAKNMRPSHFPPLDPKAMDWQIKHERQRQTMRSNPLYQFVMLVASFSNLRLESLWSTRSEDINLTGSATERPVVPEQIGENMQKMKETRQQFGWTQLPEVNGILNLSPKLYGHILEAEGILKQCSECHRDKSLEDLVTDPKCRHLFARLVSIRMNLSAFMSGLNYQLDRNWRRLHKEQNMVLRALKNLEVSQRPSFGLRIDQRLAFRNGQL